MYIHKCKDLYPFYWYMYVHVCQSCTCTCKWCNTMDIVGVYSVLVIAQMEEIYRSSTHKNIIKMVSLMSVCVHALLKCVYVCECVRGMCV